MQLNKKNKLLLVGFFFSLYMCYFFAFSNTIVCYTEYIKKSNILKTTNNTITSVPQLQLKEKQLDSLLSQNKFSENISFQNDLLKSISSNATKHQLKIIDFKEPHSFTENNQTVISYPFTLQGSYNGSVALLNTLENNNSTFGSIKHLNFIKKMNYRINKEELFVDIIIQKIK